jgi:hypothetical protein
VLAGVPSPDRELSGTRLVPITLVKTEVWPTESVVVITEVMLKLNDEELEKLGCGVVDVGDDEGVDELELGVGVGEISEEV